MIKMKKPFNTFLKVSVSAGRGTLLLFSFFMGLMFSAFGQPSSYNMIKDGNKQFKEKKFNDAEVNYRRSINTGKNLKEGNYNLGNAYYKQGKYEQAAQQFQSVSGMKSLSAEEQAKTFHNLGNSFLKENKYEESIQAYKNALKLNPNDNDTRYNLAYAQAKLQQQQQQNKDNKDKKDDKNKDQKNKDQQKQDQKQDQDKQDQQKQEQNKDQEQKDKEQKDKQQQAKRNKISKEDAEKILQALNNDEKKTQKKMNLKQPTKVSVEKEW
jgi:tetratricopeptide (TPR) repeat protein